jgi:hypothetical protein
MKPEIEREMNAQTVVAHSDPYGTWGNYYLGLIRDEANRLAKEWER